MFVVVRSIFWLTAAYMVIKPGVDLPDANVVAAQAMAAGKQVVAEQVDNIECQSLQCIGGKAVVSAVLETGVTASPIHQPGAAKLSIPYPRPRLERG